MDRRESLKTSGTAVAASNAIAAAAAVALRGEAQAAEVGPSNSHVRRDRALEIRVTAAQDAAIRPFANHPTDSEEELYPSHIATDSKGLPHNDWGQMAPTAYRNLMAALSSGDPVRFEAIPIIVRACGWDASILVYRA